MKKKLRRWLSGFLVIALLIQVCPMLSFAEEPETDPMKNNDYPYLLYYWENLLVVCFDPVYEVVTGDTKAVVSYTNPKAETEADQAEDCVVDIDQKSICRNVFKDDKGKHPQMFIQLPKGVGNGGNDIPRTAQLYIEEGAFQSLSGTPSPAQELELSQFANRETRVEIYSRNVTVNGYVLVNTQIAAWLSADPSCWDDNAVWYLDDQRVENRFEIEVKETGNHTIRMELNGLFSKQNNFYVVSRIKARQEQFDSFGHEILHGLANELISLPLLFVAPITAVGSLGSAFLYVMDGIAGCFMSMFAFYLYTSLDMGSGFHLLGLSGKWKL